jgi:hypothetical protein
VVKVAVLPSVIVLLHPVEVYAIDVIVIVVDPLLINGIVVKENDPLVNNMGTVLPVDVFAPERL